MYFLVNQQAEVVGTSDFYAEEIAGFAVHEGPDLPVEQVYFNGQSIAIRPAQPSPLHLWNGQEWVLPVQQISQPAPNWAGLLEYIQDSEFGIKAYQAACLTPAANAAWTVLQTILTNTQKSARLAFFLTELLNEIEAIAAQGYLENFTPEQKAVFRHKLAELNFPESVQQSVI